MTQVRPMYRITKRIAPNGRGVPTDSYALEARWGDRWEALEHSGDIDQMKTALSRHMLHGAIYYDERGEVISQDGIDFSV